MSNTYQPSSERAKALHGDDAFEADLSAVEEADAVSSGDLTIVATSHEVLSNNYEAGKQGDIVDLALPVEIEAALIAGGHIKRAEKKPAKKAAAPKQ